MDDEVQRSVLFSFTSRIGFSSLIRSSAILTVHVNGSCFTLKASEKPMISFRPDDFLEFTEKPKRVSATQFSIPFLENDERQLLNLKFNNSSDLQAIYAALFPLFEKAGKIYVAKRKKRKIEESRCENFPPCSLLLPPSPCKKSPTIFVEEIDEDIVVLKEVKGASGDGSANTNRIVSQSPHNQIVRSSFQFRSLVNLGNSCYMNSVLQILLYSSGVRTSFSRLKTHKEFRGNCTSIITNIFELIQKTDKIKHGTVSQDKREYLCVVLARIRNSSGIHLASHFGGNYQQDAYEYWLALLNHVEKGVNNYQMVISGRDTSSNFSSTGSPSFSKMISPSDLFRIQLSIRLGCNVCGAVKKEALTENNQEMLLDISNNPSQEESVDLLVNKCLKLVELDYQCDQCGERDCNKTLGVQYFPEYIMLLVKRYHFNYGAETKISTPIFVNRDLFLADIHIDSKMKREERTTFLAEKRLNMQHDSSAVSDQIQERVSCCDLSPIKPNSSLEHTEHVEMDKIGLDCMEDNKLLVVENLGNMEVSPIKPRLLGGNFPTPINDSVATSSDTMLATFLENPIVESVTFFKPLRRDLLCRIRNELTVNHLVRSIDDSWYESMSSAEGNVFSVEIPEVSWVETDGNCMFRSLSWWLFNGDDSHHDVIRKKVIMFMRQFSGEFCSLLSEQSSMDEYIKKMRSCKEWGTTVELYVAATLFRCPVIIYCNNAWQRFSPVFAVMFDDEDREFLKYSSEPEEYNVYADGAIYLSNEYGFLYQPVIGRKIQIEKRSLDHPDPPYVYNEKDGPVYTLTGVINHKGLAVNSGHYTAITYDTAAGVWVHCNDSEISVMSEKDVLLEAGRNGYMLIYKKRADGDEMEFTHSQDYLK